VNKRHLVRRQRLAGSWRHFQRGLLRVRTIAGAEQCTSCHVCSLPTLPRPSLGSFSFAPREPLRHAPQGVPRDFCRTLHFAGKWSDPHRGVLLCHQSAVPGPPDVKRKPSQCSRWAMVAHHRERRRIPRGTLAQRSPTGAAAPRAISLAEARTGLEGREALDGTLCVRAACRRLGWAHGDLEGYILVRPEPLAQAKPESMPGHEAKARCIFSEPPASHTS
jgi:hypothetical protein